jgi:protein SCO1/2
LKAQSWFLLVLMGAASIVAAAPELPGDSLYNLRIPLQVAEGSTVELASLRGKPLLITLFYSNCTSVCPLVTAQLQNIKRQLPAQARSNITILMVSLDADRETPDMLKTFKQEHHIEGPDWVLARASAGDVRALAAALGVRYRQLPDQNFNHSAVIALADRDGVIKERAVGPQAAVEPKFIEACRAIAVSGGANPLDDERSRLR